MSDACPVDAELEAFDLRPPCAPKIIFSDGSDVLDAFPVQPSINAAKVLEIICDGFLELTDDRKRTFYLTVEINGRRRIILPHEFLGDVLAPVDADDDRPIVFRRAVRRRDEPSASDDEAFERLNFVQAEDDVLNEALLRVDEELAAELASLSLFLSLDEVPVTPEQLLERTGPKADISMTECFPPSMKDEKPEALAELCRPHIHKTAPFRSASTREWQRTFVDLVKAHPLYGVHQFAAIVRSGPAADGEAQQLLGVGPEGVVVLAGDAEPATTRPPDAVRSFSRDGYLVTISFVEGDPLVVECPEAKGVVAALEVCVRPGGTVETAVEGGVTPGVEETNAPPPGEEGRRSKR